AGAGAPSAARRARHSSMGMSPERPHRQVDGPSRPATDDIAGAPVDAAWRTEVRMASIIELRDVSKVYQGSGVPALDHVNLNVAAGAVTAIMGPSGGGKSTLLNLIAALDRPSSGEVEVAGMPVARLS